MPIVIMRITIIMILFFYDYSDNTNYYNNYYDIISPNSPRQHIASQRTAKSLGIRSAGAPLPKTLGK